MEAQDIFGLDFDFDEFEKYGRDEFLSEDEEDEYEDEDEEDGALRRPKKRSTKKSIYEVSHLGHSEYFSSQIADNLLLFTQNLCLVLTVTIPTWMPSRNEY